jgi:hypothetical protein
MQMRSWPYDMYAKRKTINVEHINHIIRTWSQRENVRSPEFPFRCANQSDLEISKSLTHKSKTVKVYEFFSSIGSAISISPRLGQSFQTKQIFHFSSSAWNAQKVLPLMIPSRRHIPFWAEMAEGFSFACSYTFHCTYFILFQPFFCSSRQNSFSRLADNRCAGPPWSLSNSN